jgi:hypothetical protein
VCFLQLVSWQAGFQTIVIWIIVYHVGTGLFSLLLVLWAYGCGSSITAEHTTICIPEIVASLHTGCWSCLITCIVVSWLFIAVQIDDPWHNSFMSFYWEREKIGEKLLLILLLFLPSLRSLSNVSVMCGVRSGFVNESLQGKIGFHVWHLCVLSFQVMLKEGPRALYKGWDSYLGLHEHCFFNQVHVYLRCMVLHNLLGTLVRCNNSHC